MKKNEVGIRLKEARKIAGYTQTEVAKLMGMVQSAYIKYELGIIELDYEKLCFLCRLYEVSADYLLGLEDESGRKIEIHEEFTYEDGIHKITHKR